jgi:hypothetical protein
MSRPSAIERRRAMLEGLDYEQQLAVVVKYLREHHWLRHSECDAMRKGYEAGSDRNKTRKS